MWLPYNVMGCSETGLRRRNLPTASPHRDHRYVPNSLATLDSCCAARETQWALHYTVIRLARRRRENLDFDTRFVRKCYVFRVRDHLIMSGVHLWPRDLSSLNPWFLAQKSLSPGTLPKKSLSPGSFQGTPPPPGGDGLSVKADLYPQNFRD